VPIVLIVLWRDRRAQRAFDESRRQARLAEYRAYVEGTISEEQGESSGAR